jgi:DNA-binding transcriptional LysR family regulator
MNVSVRHLRALVLLSKLRNFSLAAKELEMTQPALSQAIGRLEKTLGSRLLDRTTRSVQLTPFAESIIQRLSYTLSELDEIFDVANSFKGGHIGMVSISCLSSIAIKLMPDVILECHQAHPRLCVSVQEDNSNGVRGRLLTGAAEIGIASESQSHDQLHFTPFLEDRIGVVMRRDHPLAEEHVLRWKDLRPYKLVMMSSESGLPNLFATLAAHGIQLNDAVCVASHFGTITAFISKGLGIGILPSVAWPTNDDPLLCARPLKDPDIIRDVGLIRRRGRTLSPAAEILSSLLRSEIAKVERTWHGV